MKAASASERAEDGRMRDKEKMTRKRKGWERPKASMLGRLRSDTTLGEPKAA